MKPRHAALALLFYGAFIARTAFRVHGAVYFCLFDDAMISLRYARNLAAGHGLRWNPGEPPVEGYTNFLWTLFLAALHSLGFSPRIVSLPAMLTGAAVLLATASCAAVLAQRLDATASHPRAPALAAAATLACYPLTFWTLRGTEVGLVALFATAAAALVAGWREGVPRGELAAVAALCALAVLTRPDGAVPLGAVALYATLTSPQRDRGRVGLALGAALVGTAAAHTAARLAYYGAAVPNTYLLKVSGAPLAARLGRGVRSLALNGVPALYAPLALAWCAPRRARALPLLVLAATAAYAVLVGGDAWEWTRFADRYLAPALPLVFAASARGLCSLASLEPAERARMYRGISAAFALAAVAALAPWPEVTPDLGWPSLLGDLARAGLAAVAAIALLLAARRRGAHSTLALGVFALGVSGNALPYADWVRYGALRGEGDELFARYGLAIRDATRADATVAVVTAGALPYFAERRAIDLLGKSDRVVAAGLPHTEERRPGHTKWNYAYSIGQRRPDVVAQLWRPTERDRADLAAWGYVRLAGDAYVRADSPRVDRDALAAHVPAPR